jgi:hypothetical protein
MLLREESYPTSHNKFYEGMFKSSTGCQAAGAKQFRLPNFFRAILGDDLK